MHRTQLRWRTELPLLLGLYVAYSAGRLLARGDVSDAVEHGLALLRAEQQLRINFEAPLNDLFTTYTALGVPAAFAYASLHYVVTPAVLLWLWRRRPASYRAARTWLMASTVLGLIGFVLLPTCPPRLLDPLHGFTDSMAQYGSYGWWGAEASAPRGLGGLTNQYAAMPSLHVGWSLWCGVMLWRYGGGSRKVRALAVSYPLLTMTVVMGTANHYFLDVVGGCAVMILGLLLTPRLLRLMDRLAVHRAGVRNRLRPAPAGPATTAATSKAGAAADGADRMAVGAQCHTSVNDRFPRQRRGSHDAGTGAGTGAGTTADDPAAPAPR